jgi:hypothetical protein
MAGLLDEPYIGYPQLARRRAVPNTDVETSKGLLRGISYYPYDLLGAPIDLMNMAITPLGMGSKTPVMGSEYLQGLAQKAGLSLPKTDSSSENIGRILSSIINPAAGARAIGKVIDPAMQAAAPVGRALGEQAYRMTEDLLQNQGLMPSITAYHGTPHNIQGKFDINKVGTGEGAQAYGYGMYYAENPNVAKSYATDRSYVGKFMAGTPDNTTWDAKRIAQDTLNVYGDNAITELQNTLKANSQLKNPKQLEANKELEDAIDILKTNQLKPLGNLYKVDIPDEYVPKMLNWDKPLNQQPDVLENIKKLGEREDLPKGFSQALEKALEGKFFDGQDLYYELTKVYKDPSMLSKAMEESGFKGIRYLDEGSRKTGGTSNFVVFDPKDVKILEKNSQKVESLLD